MKSTVRKAETLIAPSLKDLEVRYRLLFEEVQDGILILDAKTGIIEDINPYLIKMLGYSRQEFIKKKLWDVGAFKDIEASQEAFNALLKNKYIHYEDIPLEGKDGRMIQVEFVSNVYLMGGKKVIQCNIQEITERKKVEAALWESEERYRSTLESMMEGCQIIGYDWRYLFINDSAADQGKLKKEELLGHTMMECYPGIEKTDMFAVLRRCMDERTVHTMVNEFIYPDGSRGWFELSIQPSKKGIFILSSDITKRKQADEALRNAEARYRILFEQSPYSVLLIDLETGNTLEANDIAHKQLGYTREEFAALRISDYEALEKPEETAKHMQKIVREGSDDFETLHRTKSGEIKNIHVWAKTLQVSGRSVFYTNFQDITERKQAEKELAESEERYRMLVETLPVGVVVHSEGRVVFANPASAKIMGAVSPDDLIGKPVIEFVHPDYRELALKRIEESRSKGNPALIAEENFIRLDGTPINVEITAFPFHYAGKPAILTVFNDVTQHKQAEKEIVSLAKFPSENPSPILRLSRDGLVMYANAASSALLDMWECTVGGTAPQFWCDLADQAFARNENKTVDIECDGKVYSMFVTPVTEPGYVNIYGRDITERKQAEEELIVANKELVYQNEEKEKRAGELFILVEKLKYNEELLRETGILAKVGGTEINLSDMTLNWTEEVFRIHELEPGRMPSVEEGINYYAPKARPIIQEAVNNAIATGEGWSLELPFITAKGNHLWIKSIGKPEMKDGKTNRILGVFQDITERKQAEDRIKRQLEHLTALSAIDRIISSVFDLQLCLSEILSHITTELAIDAADILILNSSLHMLEFVAEHGFRTNAIKNRQVRLSEGYAGRVALERQFVQIPDLRDDPNNFILANHLTGEDFVCYYGVPLIAKGQVKGVLEAYHRTALEPDAEWFDFLNTLAAQAAIAIENVTLFEGLQRSNWELNMAYDATIEGWSHALDLRDKETEGHTQRVTEMTVKLASAFGLSETDLIQVRWGALLHDIGKMGVPDEILLKPDPLTDEEWVAMKKHPTFAYELLAPIRYLRLALDIPYCHHEKWDGSGYPRGLKGEQIPLVARIFAVVDVWDALMSDRPYRPAWPEQKVLDHIRSLSGTHFDPQVVKICLESGLLKGQKRP